MRKILSLAVLTATVLAAGGCGPSAPAPILSEGGYDLGGREIGIAVENAYPPFNFIDEDTGTPVGWDYDACRAICEVIHCTPTFLGADRRTILAATAGGEYDMAADGIIVTPEREEIVDFSTPYMTIRQVIVVRAGETEIVDEASLVASGALVGAQVGTVNEHVTADLVGEERLLPYDTSGLSIEGLIAGHVGAVIMGGRGAEVFAAEYSDRIKIVGEPLFGEERLAFAFPPGSGLIEPVNYALRVLAENGTLDQLSEKWWGQQ